MTTKALMKTSLGDITIELDKKKAPQTVANFMTYVKDGHFNSTIFHRVIDGFMVQCGGFDKNMVQKKTHAPIENEATNGLTNVRGTLAMARTNDIHSATSQFFINTVDNPFLDHSPANFGYCVFGKVVDGMDVVDKISKAKTTTNGHHRDVPAETIEIKEIIPMTS